MGLMTSNELKQKLDAANEKVEKRLLTIQKICKKLNINYDSLMSGYNEVVSTLKSDYLPSKTAKDIISGLGIEHKETRLPNGQWNEEAYDYNDKVNQLTDNLPKLYDVQKIAKNWQVKYDTELNKENAPKIQVLVDFLDDWGELATSWYKNNANTLVYEYNKFHEIVRKFLSDNDYENLSYEDKRNLVKKFNEYMTNEYGVHPRYRFSHIDEDDWVNAKTNIDSLTKQLSNIKFVKNEKSDSWSYDQNFGHGAEDGKYVLIKFDDDRLAKIIEAEKKAKYEDLCNRISSVVGEITNVSNLKISNKGNLDGIVEGTKGTAKVETIGAGGYNTGTIVNVKHGQIFHYRVLVHKIN